MLKSRPVDVDIVTTPEPCESCGSQVAVTQRRDDGATRLSNIGTAGQVLPGPHSPADCQVRR